MQGIGKQNEYLVFPYTAESDDDFMFIGDFPKFFVTKILPNNDEVEKRVKRSTPGYNSDDNCDASVSKKAKVAIPQRKSMELSLYVEARHGLVVGSLFTDSSDYIYTKDIWGVVVSFLDMSHVIDARAYTSLLAVSRKIRRITLASVHFKPSKENVPKDNLRIWPEELVGKRMSSWANNDKYPSYTYKMAMFHYLFENAYSMWAAATAAAPYGIDDHYKDDTAFTSPLMFCPSITNSKEDMLKFAQLSPFNATSSKQASDVLAALELVANRPYKFTDADLCAIMVHGHTFVLNKALDQKHAATFSVPIIVAARHFMIITHPEVYEKLLDRAYDTITPFDPEDEEEMIFVRDVLVSPNFAAFAEWPVDPVFLLAANKFLANSPYMLNAIVDRVGQAAAMDIAMSIMTVSDFNKLIGVGDSQSPTPIHRIFVPSEKDFKHITKHPNYEFGFLTEALSCARKKLQYAYDVLKLHHDEPHSRHSEICFNSPDPAVRAAAEVMWGSRNHRVIKKLTKLIVKHLKSDNAEIEVITVLLAWLDVPGFRNMTTSLILWMSHKTDPNNVDKIERNIRDNFKVFLEYHFSSIAIKWDFILFNYKLVLHLATCVYAPQFCQKLVNEWADNTPHATPLIGPAFMVPKFEI